VTNAEREELVIDLEVAVQMVLRAHEVLIDPAMEKTVGRLSHVIADLARSEVLEGVGK
jgi:hypothetical protein